MAKNKTRKVKKSNAVHSGSMNNGMLLCALTTMRALPIYSFNGTYNADLKRVSKGIAAWLFGGDVKKFKVTSEGGHVVVTKTNFLIALAPYFFPIYVALIVLVFACGQFFWNWQAYRVWFHLLLGAAYAFHLTLTFHILQTRQSDITSQGWLFSVVVIFLGNVTVLLVGISLLAARVDLLTALRWWWNFSVAVWQQLGGLLPRG